METALKQSLLLTHGTVYGQMPEYIQPYVFPDRTSSKKNAELVPYQRDWFYLHQGSTSHLIGTKTHDSSPIDILSWYAGQGETGETGMEIWQQCLTLFMRHI